MTADRLTEAMAELAAIADPCSISTGAEYKRRAGKALDALTAYRAQAPAEGDELPPLAVRMAAALREIAKPLAKGSKSILERAADMLEAQPTGAEPARSPCECPNLGYCDGSCAAHIPSDDLSNIVKTAPETIYLVIDPDLSQDADFTELMRSFEDSVEWCSEDSYDNGIKYIRADIASNAQPKAAEGDLTDAQLDAVMPGPEQFETPAAPWTPRDRLILRAAMRAGAALASKAQPKGTDMSGAGSGHTADRSGHNAATPELTPELLRSLKQAADWSGHWAVINAYRILSAQAEQAQSPAPAPGPVGEVIYEAKFGCKAGQLFEDLPTGTKLYAAPCAAVAHRPLPDEDKRALVVGWFAEDWAIENALGLLGDYDTLLSKHPVQGSSNG